MQYRFFLDGNLLKENPLGWDEMAVHIVRSDELKSVLVNVDATLTFTSDGYNYLKNIFATDGYCKEIKISVHRSIDNGQNFIERYKGLLFVSDMEFDDFNCSVKAKFTDDSYYGRISNRKDTQAFSTGDKTINGEDLTPCFIRAMDLFDPATGIYVPLTQTHGCYRVYDVLKYLISFMTDNQVEFDSPYFGSGGEFENLMLTYGYSIRQTGNGIDLNLSQFTQNMPPITFQKLFTELDHRFNLGFFIDLSASKPKIVIDDWNKLFLSGSVASFPDLPNLKTQVAKDKIYSSIKFGGSQLFDEIAAHFPETIRFLGFNAEEFAITGKCNIDNTLDLSYDFVSSSNAIEEILILSGTDTSFDKDWFLIDADIASGGKLVARQSNWLSTPAPYYYNERLTNFEISKRHLGFVPNSIAAYLGNGNDKFLASKTTNQAPVFGAYTKIIFQDDFTPPNFDMGGNYDPVTSAYTAPAAGVYSFRASIDEFYTPFHNIAYTVDYFLERYDSANVFIERILIGSIFIQYGNAIATFETTLLLNATDYVYISFKEQYGFNAVLINPQSTFECTNSSNGGGIYQTNDPDDYPVIENVFTTEVKDSQTDAIVSNPLSQIEFYIEQANKALAWVDDISINEFKGTINAKVLSRRSSECIRLFGPDALQDGNFALGGLIWQPSGGVSSSWTIDSTGATYDDGGSGQSGAITQFLTADPSDAVKSVGKWRVRIIATGMTTGSFWGNIQSVDGIHHTSDGDYIEIISGITSPSDVLSVFVSFDFDGKITFAKMEPQLTCPNN